MANRILVLEDEKSVNRGISVFTWKKQVSKLWRALIADEARMVISVTARKKEYGIMQAVGMTDGQLNRVLRMQGMYIYGGNPCGIAGNRYSGRLCGIQILQGAFIFRYERAPLPGCRSLPYYGGGTRNHAAFVCHSFFRGTSEKNRLLTG